MAGVIGFVSGLMTGIMLICLLQIRQCRKENSNRTMEDDGISEKREM